MKGTETMVATVPQAEVVEEQQLTRDVTDIEFRAESFIILSDEDYVKAGEFGKLLKQKAAEVITFFKPMAGDHDPVQSPVERAVQRGSDHLRSTEAVLGDVGRYNCQRV